MLLGWQLWRPPALRGKSNPKSIHLQVSCLPAETSRGQNKARQKLGVGWQCRLCRVYLVVSWQNGQPHHRLVLRMSDGMACFLRSIAVDFRPVAVLHAECWDGYPGAPLRCGLVAASRAASKRSCQWNSGLRSGSRHPREGQVPDALRRAQRGPPGRSGEQHHSFSDGEFRASGGRSTGRHPTAYVSWCQILLFRNSCWISPLRVGCSGVVVVIVI